MNPWLLAALSIWLVVMSVYDLKAREVSNWLTLPVLATILTWQLVQRQWLALVPLPIFYLLWRVQPLLQKLIDVSQRTLAVVEIMATLKCAKDDPVALERIRRIAAGEKEGP